ncbi:MAG: hypothetical protein NC131_16250, partial [Roseburia sp.]|nr:hypothetical protein [Roseburia sp.]
YLYTSKKGRDVTVKMECYYIIKRELYRRYYVSGKNTSLDAFRYVKDNRDLTDRTEETEASYDRVDKIISLMNLGEKHLIVLHGRMNGISNSQLAAILQCTIGGVHGFRYVLQHRYKKVMRKYAQDL